MNHLGSFATDSGQCYDDSKPAGHSMPETDLVLLDVRIGFKMRCITTLARLY